ncbi:MAG: hypothetical protein K6D93_05660 [Saccharofermentans sp.]|nr:hypothetical protein [Saccharofermentans sp.]
MQDEYIKAIKKIKMDNDRKIEMKKVLEQELASSSTKKPAKTTSLSGGKKAAIAAVRQSSTSPSPKMRSTSQFTSRKNAKKRSSLQISPIIPK